MEMEMEPSKVQETEKVEETDQKTDQDLSVTTHDNAHEPMKPQEESEEKQTAALDAILKSLWKVSVFLSDFLLEFCQVTQDGFTEDGEYVVPPTRQLRDFLLKNLSVTHPLEANGVFDFLVTILDLLPLWRCGTGEEEEPLNSKFEVYEVAKKICNRCKLDIESPVKRSYGLVVVADSLREMKSAFKDLTFGNILKMIKMDLMMLCGKEGCRKRNYVECMINKLPSVFTIALEWENNETQDEIFATTSVLATEIDISEIYKYEGDRILTKYHLVSMVCSYGDQYSCIAYESGSWVKHTGTVNEVIGDWDQVTSIFVKDNIRPVILFFEHVIRRGQVMFGSLAEDQ